MPRPQHEAPRMLGRYHLFEAIEEDELGELHLARLEGPGGFQRWAVVRRMHPALHTDPLLVDGFYEAARVAALIQHPNVAVTFDVGSREGPVWVAREYLHGESARALVERAIERRTHVPWDIACRVVADCALGVETLHDYRPRGPLDDVPTQIAGAHTAASIQVGFLEGSVTPDRTFITYDGKTKVVEGCLPLVKGRPSPSSAAPAYRAPELADDESADLHAEVFALGAMLWELCAGERLFAAKDASSTRQRVRQHPVEPLRARVRCPGAIDEILGRALSRDPSKRQQSCRVLARELTACLVSKGLSVTDDDVGRYMLSVFADRFEEREAGLLSAANVTEIYDRTEVLASAARQRALGGSGSWPTRPGDVLLTSGPPSGPSSGPIPSAPETVPDGVPALADSSETPEVNYVMGAPATAPSAGAPTPVAGVPTPFMPRSRRDDAETPEMTEALVLLAAHPPETIPLPLVEKRVRIDSGFDDIPTVRQDSPLELQRQQVKPPPPRSSDSVVFVARDDTTRPRERRGPDPVPQGVFDAEAYAGSVTGGVEDRTKGGTLRLVPAEDEAPPRTLGAPWGSPEAYAAADQEPTRQATEPLAQRPAPPTPARAVRPPTLSAVLIAHERRGPKVSPIAIAAACGLFVVALAVVYRMFATRGPESMPTPSVPANRAAAESRAAAQAPAGATATHAATATAAPAASPAPSASSPPPAASATAPAPAPTPSVASVNDLPPAPAPSAPSSRPQPSSGRGTSGGSRRSQPSAPPRQPVPPSAPPPAPAAVGKTGLLTVLCTPACDDVLDGGHSLGPSPVFKVAVPVGPHRLTLKVNDPPITKVVSTNVADDDTTVVRQAMKED